ncbi:MAG TPA: hypothetical protein VE646_08075 [Actinomycetota bacterium]|nr:hypothetical protein [Actinomycetota bacterium]
MILSLLFALAFIWGVAAMSEHTGGGRTVLLVGTAVGTGISLLGLILSFVSSKKRHPQTDGQREETNGGAEVSAEGSPQANGSTEEGARTYEEIFGLRTDVPEEGLLGASEGEGWSTDGHDEEEVAAEGPPPTEDQTTPEAGLQPVEPDPDGAADRSDAHDGEVSPDDHLRRMREQFRARAEEAALRVKQREAELQKTASTSDPE